MSSQTDLSSWPPDDTTHDDTDQQPDWRRITDGAAYRGHTTTDHDRTQLVDDTDACQHCGTSLPQTVRQVMGDNDNIVWECMHCPGRNRDGFIASANPANTDRDTRNPRARGPTGGGL